MVVIFTGSEEFISCQIPFPKSYAIPASIFFNIPSLRSVASKTTSGLVSFTTLIFTVFSLFAMLYPLLFTCTVSSVSA